VAVSVNVDIAVGDELTDLENWGDDGWGDEDWATDDPSAFDRTVS